MGESQEGDWLIVSDLNEIPRKSAVLALHGKDIYRFECQFFEFLYEYRIDSAPWFGPAALRYWFQDYSVLQ
ncbi:hypothetical protein EC957_008226 [Mortierella hygrophila]|uniref:Uncharacterized protein n=1 Tax=Mortierella hygrophila TaxID=979708 RepID=A0A9P6K5Z7_9FUNG|nr:hypothetical protein EC957_008226 [Mortierella hygrophila]